MPQRRDYIDELKGLGILLVVLAAWMLAARVAVRWPRARPLMIATVAVMLVLTVWVRRDAYACLVPGHGTIWNEICDVQPRDDVTAETLATLDPADEPAFFSDVGEFLFRSR